MCQVCRFVTSHDVFFCFVLKCNNFQDRELIERHITEELKLYFPSHVEYVLRDPLLFGDCRNAINANGQARIYEDLVDYESVFYLFQEVLKLLKSEFLTD